MTSPWPDDAALAQSLTDLLRALVRIPSRAGRDEYGAMFAAISAWLDVHGVPGRAVPKLAVPKLAVPKLAVPVPGLAVPGDHAPVAWLAAPPADPAAPVLLLNATVDTAGFGDEAAWRHPPLSAAIEDGWLFGRGSADSKAGIAIFCHLLAAAPAWPGPRAAALAALFDADEHTGGFAGMNALPGQLANPVAGVLIGYPGQDRIMAGARGVWRATVAVHGVAAHSGAGQDRGSNAITRATTLISALVTALARLRDTGRAPGGGDFPLPPKLTVTGIRGGGDFSMVPDRCDIDLDIRLTPALDAAQAEAAVRAVIAETVPDSSMAVHLAWPPYRLPDESPLVQALAGAAQRVLGRRPPPAVAGPANVGNLLARRGIPATCGFGVVYRNAHAADESVELASLVPVYRIYEMALQRLLRPAGDQPWQERTTGKS